MQYGLTTYGDLFTPRQLVALTTFSDLVQEARERVQRDALAAGLPDDASRLATAAPAPPPMPRRWRVSGVRRQTRSLTTTLRSATWHAQLRDAMRQHVRTASYPDDLGLCEANPFADVSG